MATKLSRIQEWPRPSNLTSFELMEGWAKKLVMSLEEDAALRLEEISPAQISNYSVMLGVGAGENNNINIDSVEGIYNVFIGHNAGFTNSTGSKNIAIGYQPMYLNTTGIENTALGSEALYTNSSGDYNIAIGDNALYAATTADFNLAIGFNALTSTTTGHSNIAIGYKALEDNTTGLYNIAIGYEALTTLVGSIDSNVGVGYKALTLTTIGVNNTAVGYQALTANTEGQDNVAVGLDALKSNTTGDNNIAIGVAALETNTTSDDNTAVGRGALLRNTGASNTALGKDAGYNNAAGTNNVSVGYQAGYGVSGNDHTANTLIGYKAGTALTTGGSNVFIGNLAGSQETTGSSKLFIAYTNQTHAGALIYGEFNNQLLKFNASLEVRGATTGTFTLSTDELTVVDGDILGRVDFQAPIEDSGTDAIVVSASIWAEADDTFADDNNETDLVFATATSGAVVERMRITKDGVLDTTAGQIKFPATQSASADANTLDDYEEGTFTPTIAFGGNTVGVTYGTQFGRYTKIGNRVFFNLTVVLTDKGSSSGNVQIRSLPFTCVNLGGNAPPVALNLAVVSFADWPMARIREAETNIEILEITNAGTVSSLTDANFANNSQIYMTGNYQV